MTMSFATALVGGIWAVCLASLAVILLVAHKKTGWQHHVPKIDHAFNPIARNRAVRAAQRRMAAELKAGHPRFYRMAFGIVLVEGVVLVATGFGLVALWFG